MTGGKCEKCGAYAMAGPRYDKLTDRLVYTCTTCGYQERRPTVAQQIAERDEEKHGPPWL